VRWLFMASGMFVFFVGYTFYAIPYWSLVEDYGGEDVNERRVLSNLLGAGLLLATAIAFVVSPILVQRWGYLWASIAFAIPAAALMVLPYFACPGHPTKRPPGVCDEHGRLDWSTLTAALRHRRFMAVIVLFAGSQMSFTVMTSAAPFIAERLLGGTDADVARLLGPFLGTAIPFFLFTPWVSRRLGWEKAVVVASLLLGGVYAATSQLGHAIIGDAWLTAMLLFATGGPMAAVLLGLEGEAITECARERDASDAVSVYWGVYNFLVKALNGVAIFVAGYLAELADDPAWGAGAIKSMSYVAGGMLVACVAVSFLMRARRPR
jgi:Na+/melibiose symporter-like transporter